MQELKNIIGENEDARDSSTLFILGNGFDINLGFPTRYKDFFASDYFPFANNDNASHGLGRNVLRRGSVDKWYDLEHIISEYGSKVYYCSLAEIEGDKADFDRLKQALSSYLSSIDYSLPDENSVASRVLKSADDLMMPPMIYTFNYTSFELIANALGLSYHTASHVHGCLEKKDIVLGVGEYVELGSASSFLYKTSNIKYNPGELLNSFAKYDNIIIFGLSLSPVDYPYFEDFFRDVSSRAIKSKDRKYIRIFTYDEDSRMAILDNLRGMNSGLIKLNGYSNFDIIRTKDDIDETKVREVIEHLSKRWKVGL